ncbi:30S ribosomal protein S4e [Candidatus Woesearchaeota archaeon]|nr:30S ribosomal protein S4e [Candidatus Woesearchaeota archaeon]
MVKNHLKRVPVPTTWNVLRKQHTFITRPRPGAHPYHLAFSLNTLMKEVLRLAATTKEVKRILKEQEVLVDGKRRHDERYNVGFMDVITFTKTKQSYRVGFTGKGKLTAFAIPAKEASKKIGKIVAKRTSKKGRAQLSLNDGRVLVVDKDEYNVGDSLVITLPKQTVAARLPFAAGAAVIVHQGKYAGQTGTIDVIKDGEVVITTGKGTLSTKRSYAFVIGDKRPALTCTP